MLLSKTKMPPLLQKTIKRPKLHERYARLAVDTDGFHKRATLVMAPAGYGKTVFLQQWMSQNDYPVIWCTVDRRTRSIRDLLNQLIQSIQVVEPKIGFEALAMLKEITFKENNQEDLKWVVNRLLDDFMMLEKPCFCVIDDYYLVQNPETDRWMGYIIEEITAMVHMVIATRFRPTFPLVNWQAKNSLQCVDVKDFVLTYDEMVCLVQMNHRLSLEPDQFAWLYEKSEGWITAVLLYCIELEENGYDWIRENRLGDTISSDPESILMFITQTFFSHLDDQTQKLLVKAAAFDQFSVSFLEWVLQEDNVGVLLEPVKRHQLFISVLDQEGQWYRFHYLFEAVLKKEFTILPKTTQDDLRIRAITYFLKHNLPHLALRQAYEGRLNDEMARILNDYSHEMLVSGDALMVIEGIQQLDEADLKRYPILFLLKIFLKLVIQGIGGLIQDLEYAKEMHDTNPKKQQMLKGVYHAIRCLYHVYANEQAVAYDHANIALAILPEKANFWKMCIGVMCGDLKTVEGYPSEGYWHYLQAHNSNRLGHYDYLTLSTGIKLAYTLRMMGRLKDMGEVLEGMLRLTHETGFQRSSKAGALWGFYGLYQYEQGDEVAASQSVERGKRLTKIDPMFYAWVLLIQVEIYVESKAYEDAIANIQEIRLLSQSNGLNYLIHFLADVYEAFLKGVLGLFTEAYDSFNQLGIVFKKPYRPGHATGYLLRLTIEVQQGNLTQTAFNTYYKDLSKMLKDTQQKHGYIQLQQIAVSFYEASGGQFFLEARNNLLNSLKKFEYHRLLKSYNFSHGVETMHPTTSMFIEPLSQRELEILELISKGFSNQSIGDTLFLSLSTVKWHTGNIYSKLGVRGRTQALAVANQLNLI